jgi:hypothetical protein
MAGMTSAASGVGPADVGLIDSGNAALAGIDGIKH